MVIKLIGNLEYSLEYRSKNLKTIKSEKIQNSLKNGQIELHNTLNKIVDLCVLPNGLLLTSNYRTLTLFNDKFEQIKMLNSIDNKAFRASGITCDNKNNRIYISDQLTDQIIMTDLDFNKIKSISSNIDCEKNQVNSIESPCFYNNQLYVPYRLNKQIKRFSKDLVFQKTFPLDYQPAQIKISNNFACVKPDEKMVLYFYDLDSFESKRVFNNGLSRISEINSNFFEYCFDAKKLFCYNQDGELKEIVDMNKFDIQTGDGDYEDRKWNGNIVYFNGHLVLSTHKSKNLIKIL
jgi:hypothetical protein